MVLLASRHTMPAQSGMAQCRKSIRPLHQQEIERREIWFEWFIDLTIRWMLERLYFESYAGGLKAWLVHVALSPCPSQILCGADRSTEVDQPIRRFLTSVKFRCATNWGIDSVRLEQPVHRCFVEIDEFGPSQRVELAQLRKIGVAIGSSSIMHFQGAEMLRLPSCGEINLNLVDALAKTLQDWNCEPLPSLGRPYAVSILPVMFCELHGIQYEKEVRLIHFVQIPQPGHELWLVNGDTHDRPWGSSLSAGETGMVV